MEKQLVAYAFAGGIDSKTDEYHVAPAKLTALQNGVFKQTGSISKRWGYKRLGNGTIGSTGTLSNCFALNEFNGELLAYDGQLAYSYSAARDAWVSKGGVVSVIQRNKNITRNTGQQLSPDTASFNGIDVYAYEDSRNGGQLNYMVFDSNTGGPLTPDTVLKTGSNYIRPKVLPFASAGVVLILYVNTTTSAIECVAINPNNPTVLQAAGGGSSGTGFSRQLVTGLGSANFFDAQVTGGQLLVAYFTSSKTMLASFDASLNPMWTTTASSSAGSAGQLSLAVDATFVTPLVWVTCSTAAIGNTGVGTASFQLNNGAPYSGNLNSPLLTQTVGPVQSIASLVLQPGMSGYNLGGNSPASSSVRYLVEAQGSASQNNIIFTNTQATSGQSESQVASPKVYIRGVGLASKAFVYGSNWYVNVAFQTQQQPTYFTLDKNANVVAKVNATLGGGLIGNSDFMLPECQQTSTGVFRYANLVKGIVNTEAGVILALLGVNATSLDFVDSNHFLSADINGGLYTVGGIVQSYDRTGYVEHGTHVYPEPITVTTSGSGGSIAAGTYNYAATYEWIDNNGLTQYSTPSPVVSITTSGATSSNTITVPTLRLTKKSKVKVVVYRTQASGTTLYRVTSATVPLYNDPTVDTVTLIDTLADASIAANGAMYTQPLATAGNPILSNAAPPACSLIAAYADRLFLAGLDDAYTLWYSKQSIATAPAEFSASLTLRLDPDGGGVTALARMDDKLIVFKQNAVFYLVGQGPTATGDQNDFLDFVQIPSGGVGCVAQSSVVLTPLGLMFDSGNGIYLLDRGLNVSYKGAPVETYTNPNSGAYLGGISSATLLPNQWAIFTTNDATGLALVYDYFYDQWALFTGTGKVVDAVVLPGQPPLLVYATSAGNVYQQTPQTFTDAGAPIVLSLTTAWLDATGQKQGYKRVYEAFLLGKYKGTHTLTVAIATNYNPSFTKLASIPVDTALGIATFGSTSPFGADPLFGGGKNLYADDTNYQFRVDVLQKCEGVRFQISDAQTGAGNEGFSLASLVMRVGVKKTGHKGIRVGKQFGAT